MRPFIAFSAFASCLLLTQSAIALPATKDKIQHIIVISLENHSFDNLFGHFPGAEGLAQAYETSLQTDNAGVAYQTLPPVLDTRPKTPVMDERFPKDLANAPFAIEKYVSTKDKTGDLIHRFYEQQAQINGGKMDRFVATSDAGALTMGYYDGSKLGLWQYAQRFTLADHFFHAAFGGSFLNHFWMICACTPRFENAPKELLTRIDDTGGISKGAVTEDGYAVNTMLSELLPHPQKNITPTHLLPAQTMATIGERLNDKAVSWAWYSGGWNNVLAGKPDKTFQYHHQPFTYFKNYSQGSDALKKHLKDEDDFLAALKSGDLPEVVFYKPLGKFNMHPDYSDVQPGDDKIVAVLKAIEQSPLWENTVVIVTFDENGGYWDHVPPPKADRWGPGVRVPTLIISPLAKKGFVDHTVYDTTSILAFIEWRHDLKPLGSRDASANNLLNALALN